VSDDEIDAASVSPDVDAAIDDAIAHLRAFNEHQRAQRAAATGSSRRSRGLVVGEKITPIASAGLFTPSGKASYPSVTYQLAVPAIVAGVPTIASVGAAGCRVAAASAVDPAVLVVCRKLGLRDVFRVNGPAGVAALGFGTERIPAVRKVVGPGSPAVTLAQVEMQRHGVSTMMLLGADRERRDRRPHGRSGAARRRSPDRGRARHRHVGGARHHRSGVGRRHRCRARTTGRSAPRTARRRRCAPRSGRTVGACWWTISTSRSRW
jgi:hypothetical protein